MMGYEDVVAHLYDIDAKAAECVGDDAKMLCRNVLYLYAVAYHGCHAYERAYLYHVGQDTVCASMKRLRPTYAEEIGADA